MLHSKKRLVAKAGRKVKKSGKKSRGSRIPWRYLVLREFRELLIGERFIIPPQPDDSGRKPVRVYKKIVPESLPGVTKPCNALVEFWHGYVRVPDKMLVVKIDPEVV